MVIRESSVVQFTLKQELLHQKLLTASFAALTSISANFPVLDAMILQFFASASGTKSLPFSSEQNKAILQRLRLNCSYVHAIANAIYAMTVGLCEFFSEFVPNLGFSLT